MKTITTDQLAKRGADMEDFVLINVLPQKYFQEKHIPHSINIPVEDTDFVQAVERVAGSKQRKIILYCASFDCPKSGEATEKLENAGFPNVYDYEGGTKDWFEHQPNKRAA